MKRSLMQVYVKGSVEAVEIYQKAFNAELGLIGKNPDGTYMHGELNLFGQILAISEGRDKRSGNNMQFCLHFREDERDIITRAYNLLKNEAKSIDYPLGPCDYSPHMASFVDKFGIYWCLFSD